MSSPRWIALAACIILIASVAHAATVPPGVRGPRTVHLRVEPGPLSLTVLKRDLNIYESEDALNITLYDPLGNEVFSETIPDDGNAGKGGGPRITSGSRGPWTARWPERTGWRCAARAMSSGAWRPPPTTS